MVNPNTIGITLPTYARPRNEVEQKVIQGLADEIEDLHGVNVVLSPQLEYRSIELAVAMQAIEVLVGSNVYLIVRPVIDEIIRQMVARFQKGPAAGQDVKQPVNYINAHNVTIHNHFYNLRDGRFEDGDNRESP